MRQLLRITTTLAFALVLTAGMAFGQDNTADVEQSGGSTADIDQTSGGPTNVVQGLRGGSTMSSGNALTQESGANLVVTQTPRGGQSAGHLLEAEQEGTGGHRIKARQAGAAHTATIDQTGSGSNLVLMNQETTLSSDGNDAYILQNGGDWVRGGSSANVAPVNSGNRALQNGSGNDLSVTQRTGNNSLAVAQNGDYHIIDLNQLRSSRAEIDQSGSSNSVAANKDGSGTFTSRNAEVYVVQDGGDSVYGGQTGFTSDVAYIDQSSGSNEANLVQQ
jgi:hypothetical protein